VQEHNGNVFNGGTAIAEGLSQADIENATFKVNSAYPNHLPTNPIPGNGQWFVDENSMDPVACNPNVIIGPNWSLPEHRRLCDYYEHLKSIKDTLPNKYFIAMFHLLKLAKLKPGFVLPDCIKKDSTLLKWCGLLKLVDISYTLDTLVNKKIAINSLHLMQLDLVKSQDSIETKTLQESISNNIAQKLALYVSKSIEKNAKLDSLKMQLDLLHCDSLINILWINVWKQYIKFIKNGTIALHDRASIAEYSSKCADEYGDAVYIARMMASTFSNQDFSIFDNCFVPINTEIRSKKVHDVKSSLSIFPNPSLGDLTLSFDHLVSGKLSILNVNGEIIHQANIFGSKEYRLELNLNSGLYLVKILTDDQQEIIKKVVIIH
jgi:hypothetical protein